ncbi:hypothetical protein [Chelativorans sp.]|nr:hypothetical protein [Chelativorans sp.]
MPEEDIKAKICSLLDWTMEQYGPSIELQAIESSWAILSMMKEP